MYFAILAKSLIHNHIFIHNLIIIYLYISMYIYIYIHILYCWCWVIWCASPKAPCRHLSLCSWPWSSKRSASPRRRGCQCQWFVWAWPCVVLRPDPVVDVRTGWSYVWQFFWFKKRQPRDLMILMLCQVRFIHSFATTSLPWTGVEFQCSGGFLRDRGNGTPCSEVLDSREAEQPCHVLWLRVCRESR